MKYKIGDKVKVRKDLILGGNYGGYIFSRDMKGFKGKTFTIQKVGSDYYRVKEESFSWTDEMFEPVITNLDKVKEEIDIKDVSKIGNPFCQAVHRVRDEENCIGMRCDDCARWLKQPYKEPSILDEAEKKYLSAVIRPWRNRVNGINKRSDSKGSEYITISIVKEWCPIQLPMVKINTMYKGMELNKTYTLDDLEI